jgi:hypothetical protein
MRGRSLIGMNIWGPNRQYLGSVKDFIVDYQGDCPALYFAVAPQISGWSGDYVIVPFTAFQVGFDPQQRTDYFTLNMTVDNLGRAPRLAVDKWNTVQDHQAFAGATQFYQRVEHTAARPQTGGREENPSLPSNQPRPGEGSQPQIQQPRQQPPVQQRPEANRPPEKQPEPSKPAAGTQPNAGREPNAAGQTGTPKEPNQDREKRNPDNRERPDNGQPSTR